MQPVAAQPIVTVTKPHGAHGDGVKHRRIIARAWRRRKLSPKMLSLIGTYRVVGG